MSARVASAGPLSAACAEFLTHCYPKGCAKTHGPRCRMCSLWERQADPQCARPCIRAWNPTWDLISPGWESPQPSKVAPVKEVKHSLGWSKPNIFLLVSSASLRRKGQAACTHAHLAQQVQSLLASAPFPCTFTYLGGGGRVAMTGSTKKE